MHSSPSFQIRFPILLLPAKPSISKILVTFHNSSYSSIKQSPSLIIYKLLSLPTWLSLLEILTSIQSTIIVDYLNHIIETYHLIHLHMLFSQSIHCLDSLSCKKVLVSILQMKCSLLC